MPAILALIGCGLLAGVLGGYLGVGGGIVIVPFLTLVMGLDIKAAVPVSVAAIVINSLASSSEYLRNGMVNLELVVVLTISMVVGTIIGSMLLTVVASTYIKLIFAAILVYTAITFLRGKESTGLAPSIDHNGGRMRLCGFLSFCGGILAGLVGIGGGVIVIPLMFLVLGVPLGIARGTSSFIVGFAGAASVSIYFTSGLVDLSVAPAVMFGTVLGGKVGGSLGAVAKPRVVKILFFVLLLYTAVRLAFGAIGDLR
ncbi:MAG: sulfite exporter TauE/SafE family protein [Candidatus Zixiibacteriota bacterium]